MHWVKYEQYIYALILQTIGLICSVSPHNLETDSDAMRTRLLYPALDSMLSELNSRFAAQNDVVYRGVHACNPDAATFLNVEDIHNFTAYYNLHLQKEELCVAKNFIRAKQQNEKDPITMQIMYHTHYKLLM